MVPLQSLSGCMLRIPLMGASKFKSPQEHILFRHSPRAFDQGTVLQEGRPTWYTAQAMQMPRGPTRRAPTYSCRPPQATLAMRMNQTTASGRTSRNPSNTAADPPTAG